MNTFKKNQIIITALAIMIAIAGYLNFTGKADNNKDQYVLSDQPQDVAVMDLDATGLVPNDENLTNVDVIQELEESAVTTMEDADVNDVGAELVLEDPDLILEAEGVNTKVDEVGEAVFVSSTSIDSGYFLKTKIEREHTRAASLDILLEVIDNENLGEEQKVEAASKMIQLQDRIEREAAAESLLIAKGYSEVFVLMDDTKVDVVINAKEITATDLAQISDIVSRKTGVDPSLIVIAPLKTLQAE